ncbi:MAG TPA: BACON domain-containing carbohydrate-binding protein, partial [Opitutaceae bacterium]|nr:BACON domain-containing carbohydrate-binding protein [Opitutaceae bacterium]
WQMAGYSAAPNNQSAGAYDGRTMLFVGNKTLYVPTEGEGGLITSSQILGATVLWDGRRWLVAGASEGVRVLDASVGAWTVIAPAVTETYWDSVWSGSRYVLVGDGGRVASSTDAIHWVMDTLPGGGSLRAVCAGAGRFVVVGEGGFAWTSEGGTVWVRHSTGVTSTLRDVLWDGTRFVAVGDGGAIRTSVDGAVWSVWESGVSKDLWAIARAGERYVVVGSSGTVLVAGGPPPKAQLDAVRQSLGRGAFSYTLALQAEGAWSVEEVPSWISVTPSAGSGSATLTVSTTANPSVDQRWGRFFVGGEVHSVTQQGTGGQWVHTFVSSVGVSRLATDGQRFLVATMDSLSISANGIDFTGVPAFTPGGYFRVTHQNGRFFAVGSSGRISTSTDGMIWSTQTTAFEHDWTDVAWNGTTYVAAGNRLATSPDGATWTLRSSLTSPDTANAIAYGAGRFVAVGLNGTIVSSADGVAWIKAPSLTGRQLFDVTWNGSTFLAVGDRRTVLKSADGLTWQVMTEDPLTPDTTGPGNTYSYGVWDGNRWVVSTRNGLITSTTGSTWTDLIPNVASPTELVAYAGGLAVGTSSGHLARLPATTPSTSVAVAPDYRRVRLAGETYDLKVMSDGPWTVSAPAVVSVSPGSGSGPGTVRVQLPAAEFGSGRSATLFVGSARHTSQQASADDVVFDPTLMVRTRNASVPVPGTVSFPTAGRESSSPSLLAHRLGGEPSTLQWRRDGVPIPGATHRFFYPQMLRTDESGNYDFVVTRNGVSFTSKSITLRVTPPSFTPIPLSTTVEQGGTLSFPLAFIQLDSQAFVTRWYRNGVPVGAPVQGSRALQLGTEDSGVYQFELSTERGETFRSPELLVTVYVPGTPGQRPRLANLSALNVIAPGAGTLIAGFSSSGSGGNQVVVRGIGPTLRTFGVPQPISTPRLQLYDGNRLLEAASGWSFTDGRELGGFRRRVVSPCDRGWTDRAADRRPRTVG